MLTLEQLEVLASEVEGYLMEGAASELVTRGVKNPDTDAILAAIHKRVKVAIEDAYLDGTLAGENLRVVNYTSLYAHCRLAGVDAVREVYPINGNALSV